MNHLTIAVLIGLAFIAGCNHRANTASDDLQWLEKIDQRLNNADFDIALEDATKYVEQYPHSCRGWGSLGWAYVKTNEFTKAQQCFDKSLSINPEWDNAHVGKGAAYRAAGENGNARKCYLEALRIVPNSAEAYSSLLVIELLAGNDKKAAEYGEKGWALRKNHASIPANLAIAYHYLGDNSKRDQFFKHAERLGYHNLQDLRDIFDGKTSIR